MVNYRLNTGIFENDRNRAKIIFAFISDYFYCYRFYFFYYRYLFRLGLKIRKNSKSISKNRRLSFLFLSLLPAMTKPLILVGVSNLD
jgi:hypothetical protein